MGIGCFSRKALTPGTPRKVVIAAITAVLVTVCLLLVLRSGQSELILAVEIFGISVAGFSVVAGMSYDATFGWRLVDFPWICASFAAIVVALLNISEADRRDHQSAAKTAIGSAFTSVIYAAQMVVTACDLKPLPEPQPGECNRMKELIPQMTMEYEEFGRLSDVYALHTYIENIPVQGAKPEGQWKDLYGTADNFLDVEKQYGHDVEMVTDTKRRQQKEVFRYLILSTELRYWYFAMAFFVGLRLSKTTAEILQLRAAQRRQPAHAVKSAS